MARAYEKDPPDATSAHVRPEDRSPVLKGDLPDWECWYAAFVARPNSMKLSGVTAASLLLLLVLLPASLAAISVFDVIRLSQERYADEEIMRLIRTTDSRFVLSAEDTIRLRKEGLTEAVIREMLSRPAPTREGLPPTSEGAAKLSLPPEATRSFAGVPTGARPGRLFSASSLKERDAGHALAAVTLA